jgi:hypothetical protein
MLIFLPIFGEKMAAFSQKTKQFFEQIFEKTSST